MPEILEHQVIVIHDASASENASKLAKSVNLALVSLELATPDVLRRRSAAIVDIDLRNTAQVKRLREVFSAARLNVPLLFAVETGEHAYASRVQANALGARQVLRRPLTPDQVSRALEELDVQVRPPAGIESEPGGVSIKAAAKLLDGAFRSISEGAPLDIAQTLDTSRQLLAGVGEVGLGGWLDTVRGHHDGTFQHCLLVAGSAVAYALEAKMPEKVQLKLIVAALLHDIGKSEIPLEILDKAGGLSEAEFEVIKRHPAIARDYLRTQRGLPPDVLLAVTHHHEFLDGSGYPDQLQGDEIGQLTRILTVCDIYAALSERRAYKKPKAPHEAILILADMARRGKVEYECVRTMGMSVGVSLPATQFHIA